MTKSNRPNIVLIFMDDQAFRTIGSLNNPEIQTPNLDRLLKSGTGFTHAFNQGAWSEAVCVASRAMLITGMNLFRAHRQVEVAPLLGEHLAAHGYNTFFTGKWHNSQETLVRSYETVGPWFAGLNVDGYSPENDAYSRPSPGNEWRPDDETQGRHWMRDGDRVLHSSELWTNAAVGFIAGSASADRPFFLHLAHHAPHDPRQSRREFLDLYPEDGIEVPPNFQPEHPFDQGDSRSRDEYLAPFPRTEDAVRLHRREYYAILTHVDEQIGRVLDALDEQGVRGNTVVVFSSDHGLAVGEHGLMGKQNQYDHSVRVPLIFSGPGVPSDLLLDALVYQASIFATLCDLVGAPLPESVEMPSLAGILQGDMEAINDSVFGAYRDYQRMVRTTTHKLIAYPEQHRHQLFDVQNDPWETTDQSSEIEQAEQVATLRAELEKWQAILGDGLDISPAFRSTDPPVTASP